MRISGAKNHRRGAPGWAQPTRAPPLQARLGGLSPPGGHVDPETDAIKSHIFRKNEGERIIVFHETEPPPSPVLHREATSRVRLGLRRGGIFNLRHHLAFSIANFMMLTTVRE